MKVLYPHCNRPLKLTTPKDFCCFTPKWAASVCSTYWQKFPARSSFPEPVSKHKIAWDDTEGIVLLQRWCFPRQTWTCQMKSAITTVLKKVPVLLFGISFVVERKLSEAVQFWMCFSKNANIYPNGKGQIREIYKLLYNNNAKEYWEDINASVFPEWEKWDIHGVWVDRPYGQGHSFVEKWEIAPCKVSLQHLFILLLHEGTPKVLDRLNTTCHHSLQNCCPGHEDVLP